MEKIELEIIAPNGETVLVICNDWGHVFTAQTGGLSCNHPVVIGNAIVLKPNQFKIDTCNHPGGCYDLHIEDNPNTIVLAKQIDEILRKETAGQSIEIVFDFERSYLFQEAWIPVLAKIGNNFEPGILFTNDNCD